MQNLGHWFKKTFNLFCFNIEKIIILVYGGKVKLVLGIVSYPHGDQINALEKKKMAIDRFVVITVV